MQNQLVFEQPYGCRWCGDAQHHHGSQWSPIVGLHSWVEPEPDLIKTRMLARRETRLTRQTAKYHATTGWAVDHTGESAAPYCADCKTDSCPRWWRVQDRLTRARQGLPRRVRRSRRAGTGQWGGDLPF